MQGGGQELIKDPEVGWGPVGGHLGRSRSLLKCLGEEPTGGRRIPFLCGEDVDDLAEPIDRPIQINPPTRDFDTSLIDKPSIPWGVLALLRSVENDGVNRCIQRQIVT